MTNQTKNWLIGILILIVLVGIFFSGYYAHSKWRPCPVLTHDTTYVTDTVIHTIIDKVPYYVIKTDSIIIRDTVFKDVDTTAILKNYFALYYYDRVWEDSLLKVQIKDVITENKPIDNTFTYQIKRPQTVIKNIDNTITYTKGIYLGGGFNLNNAKYSNLEVLYMYRRGYTGLGYLPYQNNFVVKIGFKLINFR
jgi:hypothetical protein